MQFQKLDTLMAGYIFTYDSSLISYNLLKWNINIAISIVVFLAPTNGFIMMFKLPYEPKYCFYRFLKVK